MKNTKYFLNHVVAVPLLSQSRKKSQLKQKSSYSISYYLLTIFVEIPKVTRYPVDFIWGYRARRLFQIFPETETFPGAWTQDVCDICHLCGMHSAFLIGCAIASFPT